MISEGEFWGRGGGANNDCWGVEMGLMTEGWELTSA